MQFFPCWLKLDAGVQPLGMRIFGMNGELNVFSYRMLFLHQLNKCVECGCTIPFALVRLVDEKVVDPILVTPSRLVRKFK